MDHSSYPSYFVESTVVLLSLLLLRIGMFSCHQSKPKILSSCLAFIIAIFFLVCSLVWFCLLVGCCDWSWCCCCGRRLPPPPPLPRLSPPPSPLLLLYYYYYHFSLHSSDSPSPNTCAYTYWVTLYWTGSEVFLLGRIEYRGMNRIFMTVLSDVSAHCGHSTGAWSHPGWLCCRRCCL